MRWEAIDRDSGVLEEELSGRTLGGEALLDELPCVTRREEARFITAQVLTVDGGRMDFLSHSG